MAEKLFPFLAQKECFRLQTDVDLAGGSLRKMDAASIRSVSMLHLCKQHADAMIQ